MNLRVKLFCTLSCVTIHLLLTIFSSFSLAQPVVQINSGHGSSIQKVTFSPNGEFIATAGDDRLVKLWDASSLREIRTFRGHEGEVKDVTFSPDGRYLASGGRDGTRVWELSNGIQIVHYEEHDKSFSVSAVDFHPNGKILAIGSHSFNDKSYVKLKNIRDATDSSLVFEGYYQVWDVKFSPDGSKLAVAYKTEVKLYDSESTELLGSASGGRNVRSIDFTKDGREIIYGGENKKIYRYYTEGMKYIDQRDLDIIVFETYFSHDERSIIASGKGNELYIWPKNIKEYKKLVIGEGDIRHTDLHPNGKLVLTGGSLNEYQPTLFELETGKLWLKPAGTERINDLKISKSGQYVISGSGDGSYLRVDSKSVPSLDNKINIWDLQQAKEIKSISNTWGVEKLNLFDDKYVATFSSMHTAPGSYNQQNLIKVFDITSGELLSQEKAHLWHLGFNKTPDGKRLITTLIGGKMHEFDIPDLKTRKQIKDIGPDKFINSPICEVDPLGGRLRAAGFELSVVWIYKQHIKKDSLWYITAMADLDHKVTEMSFSSNAMFLAAGDMLGNVFLLNIDSVMTDSIKATSRLSAERFARKLKGIKIVEGQGQGVTQILFSHDNEFLFSSSGGVIYKTDIKTGKSEFRVNAHDRSINSLQLTTNGLLLTSSYDGTIKIWSSANGEHIATLLSLINSDGYVIYTPDGYYTAAKSELGPIHFVDGFKVYGFDQFDLKYNRPDIVAQRIGKAPESLVKAYYNAWQKRVMKMGFDPMKIENEEEVVVPKIDLITELEAFRKTKDSSFNFQIEAVDLSRNLKRLFVSVNGVPMYGIKGRQIDSEPGVLFKQSIYVTLQSGTNIVDVSVMNDLGVESLEEEFTLVYEPATRPNANLHLIAIGVSDFQQSEFNLTYANKDANDISQTFSSNSGGFDNITVHTLTNEKATRENVLALRKELEQTKVDDEVIVFVASHGLLDEELDYYLAMHDTDFANPKNGGLRYDELEALIDGIPARNKAMFIDACHSGEVDKEESELVAANDVSTGTVKSRGFKRVTTKASNSGIGLKTSFELMKELFADLRRNNGAIVISSASGEEYAFESSEWQNGVFTYSLLEGLKSGNADLNKDGEIVVSEIRDYVSKRVQELTNGKQNPTSRTENLENDFRVW